MINQFYIDYIKAIENPDRVGWNGKVWTAPQYKGYDKNQRGYGIDIVKNDSAKRLTQNRPGQWLTEGEADKLMREHLLYVYGAAQKHIEGFDNLSDRRKAALLGMLYRGDSVNKNRHIININEPDDNKFFESINNYYKSKGLNERARNSSNFFNNNQLTNFLIPMKWEQWEPPMKFKSGGRVRKMLTASGGPIHYSRTMTADNLSKAANYVGEYVLKGLGAFGKIFTAPLTGGPLGPATVVLPKTKELLDAERKLREAQEELIGKAMTWVSPLNYGAALATGNGLNARKGEEEVASWSPAWLAAARLGELYVGPKAVKGVKATPRAVVNTAARAGVKPAKTAVVAREIKLGIKLNTKNGRIEVTGNYFNSPDKWYRITETPEKYGIMELGKNVTTHDASQTYGTINGWRSSMLRAPITKSSEGFIKRPHKIEIGIRRKNGQAHGNTSQAAKGELWGGTTSGSNLFPEGIIEGQAPSMINYGIDRTNFVITPWELVPNGGRVGFHTGEMPMSNLGWFQRTNKGTYTYEPIIPEKRITYHPILLLEPSTSLAFFERPALSNAQELAGATKWERNFTPKWHVANYPGYLLKGLMKGSLLEKQLSKNGTININLLNAYFNKASQIEKDVVNKVLNEKFAGLKTIDYNLFKKAVLEELIGSYNRIPLTTYASYGMERLGYNLKTVGENELPGLPDLIILGEPVHYTPPGTKADPINLSTFTFESPRISLGSDKHYGSGTLGHSRTFTTLEEPKVLNVMESLSDWSLEGIVKKYAKRNTPERIAHLKNSLLRAQEELERNRKMIETGYNELGEKLEPYAIEQLKEEIIPNNEIRIKLMLNNLNGLLHNSDFLLQQHLSNNYLQRLLQENLKFAAENGLTKMRYPTSETAAKIEGYLKTINPKYLELLDKLSELQMKLNELLNQEALHKMFNEPFSIKDNLEETYKVKEELKSILDEILQIRKNGIEKAYIPEHQTILKKYADFPKLFLKLFKDLKVRIVTDAKGNTWYEVDVPKGYLSREWLFKKGGKMNILEFLKNGSGIHIKEKNKGKFTSYCGGKVTDECILKGKNSSNPAIRKRATFAANARKWKHKEGGVLKAQFGLPLNISSEDIKGGFNFIKQGLGKVWDIVNTPIIDTSGVSVQLPNGSLLNIQGTQGGAPEILPGRMDKGVLLIEKHAPNFFRLINEFPTLAKNLVLGNVKLFKEFFKTGNKDLLKWFETKSDFMLRTPNSKPAIPKGFTKGNEVAPTSGTQPISETGLNIRETRLGNMNNPPKNPSEKLAVEDWNTMNPNNQINPLLPTGRPSYKIELDGLKIDIRYPKLTTSSAKKIKTDYTQSGTSLERAVEGKRYGIPRKGRVSSNDRNARAMESGDARTTNAGYTNVKKGQIKLVENNLDKYPEYERKALEQRLLRMYRKNRPESEINKVKREFYKYLARRYGYFKTGGVIKANTGTKFNWNSALNTGVNLMGQFLPSIIGGGNNLSYSLGNNNYSDIMTNTALLYMLNQQLENEVLSNYDKIMSKLHFDPSNPNANGGSIVKNHVNYLAQAPVIAGLKEFNDNYKKFLDEQIKLKKTNYITNALTNTLLTGFDLALNYKPTTKKGSSVS